MNEDRKRLAGLRVLIVEDEWLIAMDLEQILLDLKCEVVRSVATVEDAIAMLGTEHRLDGVFLDMNLNGEDVRPVVAELTRKGLPFILSTGYARRDTDPPALRDARRLSKPFNAETVADAMIYTFPDPST